MSRSAAASRFDNAHCNEVMPLDSAAWSILERCSQVSLISKRLFLLFSVVILLLYDFCTDTIGVCGMSIAMAMWAPLLGLFDVQARSALVP